MTYIKLLTVLTTLALLTACGGAAAPKTDNTGDTGEVNTTDCTATPFDTNCDAVESAITSRQTTCFASATANRRCGVVIEGACRANPFRAETACMADTYLPNRIAECIKGGEADEGKCATITTDAEKNTMVIGCLENPFDIVCQTSVTDFTTYANTARMNRLTFCNDGGNVADDLCTGNNLVIICGVDPFNAICFTDDTYLSPRITNCIMAGNAGEEKCNTLLSDTAMNTAITSCLTNPFATACESVTAFTDFALARTNRASFCDNSDNITNTLCMGESQMGVCGSNPFNASCFTDKTYLPMRLTDCITTASTELPKCNTLLSDTAMNTTITACLTNPFTDACASNADFMTYADDARTNREGFCGMSGNESKAPCTALTACQGNPFATTCGAYFEMTRTNRVGFCDMAGNDTNALCMGANLMGVCVFDPFNAICFTGATYDMLRQTACLSSLDADDKCLGEMGIATVFCKANPFDTRAGCTEHPEIRNFQNTNCLDNSITPKHSTCTELVAVNHADYLASFGDTPPPATVAEAIADIANTNITSFFISVGADGILDTTGLATSTTVLTKPPPVTLSRAGDEMDGFTHVLGVIGNAAYSIVGLLPSTDLGAPLIEAPMDTTWEGQYYDGLNNATNDITFTINFDMKKITAMDDAQTFTIDFDLDFTVTGVITGIVDTNLNGSRQDTAPVRGLIGEQGLVGIFANTNGGFGTGGLYGGFVADNPDYTAPE